MPQTLMELATSLVVAQIRAGSCPPEDQTYVSPLALVTRRLVALPQGDSDNSTAVTDCIDDAMV